LFFARSLYRKLGGSMLLLFVAATILVGTNIYFLQQIRADVAGSSNLGRSRVAFEILYLSRILMDGNVATRPEIAAQIRELAAQNERVLASLLDEDPERRVIAQRDPRIVARLIDNRHYWDTEIAPLLQRLLDGSVTGETAGLLGRLEASIRNFASRTSATIDLMEEGAAERLDRAYLLQLLFSLVLLLVLFLVLWNAQDIAERARLLARTAERISAGDISETAPVRGNDELAVLGSSFNAMTAKLTGMIDGEREGKVRLEHLLDTIAETAGQLATLAAEILASATEQAAGMRQQSSAVAETVTSVDEVLQTADQAAQRARAVADSSERAAETSTAGREAVDQTTSAMNAVREKTETIAEGILSLAERSQAIGEIVAVVSEIADQTNLLALNAAIEASRAGEHGRGFSVVASEIRTLADQSKKATGQVRQILSEIQKATNSAVMMTEEGARSVNKALEAVSAAGETIRTLEDINSDASRLAAQIAASAGQQNTGMTQIQQAMTHINQASNQNLAATRQTEQAARNLNELGKRLNDLLSGYGR
jgi:methyl-accepting chemotaxis protein